LTHDACPTLVIGTHNRKKGAELAELLSPHGLCIVTLDDVPDAIEVIEGGDSFEANARLKASQQAVHLGRWVLADDSGLAVDALDGAPGVYSARFALLGGTPRVRDGRGDSPTPFAEPQGVPPGAIDELNNRCLLEKLGNTPLEKRTAHYVCHVSVADPTGTIRAESHDVCHGWIRFEPTGTNGFGYDPLFEVVEYHRTFGELGPHVKQAISHRSRALRAIVPKLVEAWSKGQGAGS
jgi:XTP/dITP diphosphohydrolase